MIPTWQSIAGLGIGVVAYQTFSIIHGLRKNIQTAERTGLPYVVAPWSSWNLFAQITAKIWVPIVKALPRRLWENWIDIVTPEWGFDHNYAPFARIGDAHLAVSPGDVTLNLANAELIRQITQRRDCFPKELGRYNLLRIFGESVVTTEGAMWRMHRRVSAATFNERNSALVFAEAAAQSQSMLAIWLEHSKNSGEGATIRTLEHDAMRLALHIIGYVGFGLRLLWPGEDLPAGTDPRWAKYGALKPHAGHTLSFVDAVVGILDNIFLILLIPQWLLRLLPFKATRNAADARQNYEQYMNELVVDKRDELMQGEHIEGMDLVGQLVGSTMSKDADGSQPKSSSARSLTETEILGNLFIMLVAGHETSANIIHFAIAELAARPRSQRQLQRDIDTIYNGADPSTWSYDSISALAAGMAGAAANETLRKMPPAIEVPKEVAKGSGQQTVTVDGVQHVLPEGVSIALCISSIQRNPRYWPCKPSEFTNKPHDLDDWVPERWLTTSSSSSSSPDQKSTESSAADDYAEDLGGYRGSDTSASLFRPERGAFIPFSDGARACLGRRFAQVEILAALAVVFREHSIELAVDQWATDAEVDAMDHGQRAALYARAQAVFRKTLLKAYSTITLKLHDGDHVPVRLVKRGEERFVSWVE